MLAPVTKDENHDSLASLRNFLEDDMNAVDRLIEKNLQSQVTLIPHLARHLIHAGGKRLRPLLTLAAYRLFTPTGDAANGLAAAVEFIHTATLLHDDVVDESHSRRGLASANDLWGNSASILVGDFLFARSFQLMVECGNSDVLGILAAAAARIAEGEVLQLSIGHNLEAEIEELLQVVEAKTAELFAAACQAGALMAGQSLYSTMLGNYGKNLGMAFQIVDDILDYTSQKSDLGKNIGDDFREGKITLPVLIAFPHCNEDEKQFLKKSFVECNQASEDFEKTLKILQERKVFALCYTLASDYGQKALLSIVNLPDHPVKNLLQSLVDHCLQRLC